MPVMSKQNIARIILGVLIFVCSFLLWYFLDFALNTGEDWLMMIVPSGIAFLVLGVVLGIFCLLEEARAVFVAAVSGLILGSFVIFLAVFGKRPSASDLILAAVAFLSFLFFVVGAKNAWLEKSSRLKIVASLILRKGLAPALTALALFGALLFYWSPYARSLDKEIVVPRPLFDAISAPIIKSIAGAEKAPGMDNFAVPAGADFSDQFYRAVNSQVNALGKPYKKFIPFGAAVSLFFTFKLLGIILIWPIVFLDWLALKLLVKLGIVSIKKITTEKETLEM